MTLITHYSAEIIFYKMKYRCEAYRKADRRGFFTNVRGNCVMSLIKIEKDNIKEFGLIQLNFIRKIEYWKKDRL